MAWRNHCLRELQGPLLPPKDLEEEDDDSLQEDVEEGEDPLFVDAEELCSGGVKAGSLPGRLRGEEAPAPEDWDWGGAGSVSHSGFVLSWRPVVAYRLPLGWPTCFALLRLK